MILTKQATANPMALSSQRRIGPRDAGQGRAVAIVGAGFSGTMAAIHLRRVLPPDCVVYLFDRTGRFARGPAYAASDAPHLLNVRTGNMSAMPDDPGHFERWMAGRAARWPDEVHTTAAGTFATRRIYGRYLRALLYEEMSLSGGRVRLSADEAGRPCPEYAPQRFHRPDHRTLPPRIGAAAARGATTCRAVRRLHRTRVPVVELADAARS